MWLLAERQAGGQKGNQKEREATGKKSGKQRDSRKLWQRREIDREKERGCGSIEAGNRQGDRQRGRAADINNERQAEQMRGR